jgi:hypothetical protein
VQVTLGSTELRTLISILEKQIEWNSSIAVRVVTSPSAVAFYAAIPLNLHAFIAMPAKIGTGAPCDVITTGRDVVALLSNSSGLIDLDSLEPLAGVDGASLSDLPPSTGWQIPIHAVASDVIPIINEAASEFDRRSVGLGERGKADLAEEIWNRPGWGGLPVKVLYAAQRLNLIWDEPIKISAATCGPWKRLSTPRGQVFLHAAEPSTRSRMRLVKS